MSKKYALLVDLRKCVGCTSCQVSCKMENAAPIGQFRSKVDIADTGEYPKP
ncbi:MAG: 4Fe-4S dicluster domain-containing protein, partial [Nitrospirae bacterium]|nr:4Fe-4S dicluster domain-containing protein [Nitrospirota bacterium]